MKFWLLSLWLLVFPNTPAPAWVQATGGPTWTQAERVAKAPIIAEGKSKQGSELPIPLPYRLGTQTTNYFHASESQAKNIELVAHRLNGVVVQPGQIFSYYQVVGPYTAANGYGWGRAFVGDRIVPSIGGGVCQGASTLYAAILRTGLPVIERHKHGLTVPYLPPGEDATVSSDYLNFRFKNSRPTPVLIQASAGDRHLTVSVWGASPGPEITVQHKILATYPFRTIVKINPELAPGSEKVIAPGQNGVKVDTWLEIHEPTGVVKKSLGIDSYRSSPRVVERSTRTAAPSE